MGVPVVGAYHTEYGAYAGALSGFVTNPGDDTELFARVEHLLDDPKLRKRMGLKARKFAEGLSWEAVLEGLVFLHAQVAGDRPVEPPVNAGL